MDKTAGILFAISSLPSKYGIGCFSKEAYKFVDWLVEAGQTFWQILPLGPTGYGDSPYQSFSTFAGNPYFIDLETLISEGLLTREECDSVDFGTDEQSVDYEKQYNGRYVLLRKACERSGHKNSTEYKAFLEKNESCGARVQDGITICPECGRPVVKMKTSLGLKGENGKKPVQQRAYTPTDDYGDIYDGNSIGGTDPVKITKES